MEGPLCDLCAEVDIHGAVERLSFQEGSEEGDSVRVESPWHSTMAAVESSASSCSLCAVIMRGWRSSREVVVEQAVRDAMFDPKDPPAGLRDPVHQIAAYRDAPGITLEISKRARAVDDGRKNKFSLFLRVECGPATRASFDVLDPVTAELRIVRESQGPLTAKTVDAVPTEISLYTDILINPDPLSQESLAVARSWLEACVERHGSACSPPAVADGWLPTRLLEVVPGADKIYLRLRETTVLLPREDSRYVALSHCWGQGGTPFTTTHQTLSLRMDGIDINALPQTFRDSVTLTERLGLRYLWIDSLCIIQDDAEDWAREAALMASVYRDAHLVLNAANSEADATGFLCPRDVPDTARLPMPSPNRQQLYLQLLLPAERRWSDPAGLDNLIGEPISSRAWCLQERSLPRRALQYGSHQIFWECERMRASEDGDAVLQDGGLLKRLYSTADSTSSVFARPNRDPWSEQEQNVNWVGWYRMIEDYTARSITKHTDRLPALSGLAQAVVRKTESAYLAGLWKTGLLEGLLWCKAQDGQALTKTPEYVAPSWSWASVVGPVKFPIYAWYSRRAHWKAKMADFEPLAEYVGHEMAKQDLDEYGRLQSGVLVLKAPLLPVLSTRERQSAAPMLYSLFGQGPSRSEMSDIMVQMKSDAGDIWIDGGFDNPETAVNLAELFVVFLTRLPHVLEEGFVEHRFGLLLQRLGNGTKYERVGFVDGVILKKSIFDVVRGRGMFSILGYPRPYTEGDIDEVTRDNDLASDPLMLDKVEITIV